jgi:hypothetical protein
MIVDGITAANDIGLSDAVPAHIIVHTDARLKSLVLGNLTIHFKKTAPCKLFWAVHLANMDAILPAISDQIDMDTLDSRREANRNDLANQNQ